jgi:hypothetical protein
LPPVASLRDMMRKIGDDDASYASHGLELHDRSNSAIGIMSP